MPRKKINSIVDEPVSVPIPEPEPEPKTIKTKKPISDERKQHLDNIRPIALQKKKEMKEISLKAKLGKNLEKMELAKKYDEHVNKKIVIQPQILPPTPVIKPKKSTRKVKRYISESETDETESEEEEVVYIKKKNKPKQSQPQPQKQESLNHLLYQSAQERLQARVLEERLRNRISDYQNALTPSILGKF